MIQVAAKVIKPYAILLFTVLCGAGYTNAQLCTNANRFTETEVFTDSQIDSNMNVVYGTAINWQGQSENLSLNVYYPRLSVDTLPLRPAIIMIHGGGFVNGDKTDLNFECREFAKRGFVAATINYRLGRNCNQDSLSYDLAVYRAMQDGHAAFRYAVSKAGNLRIDTSWLFIAGSSAGAGTSLGLVYLSQSEWNAFRPLVVQALGSLITSGNTLTNTFTLKGVFNNWGAIGKDFIQPAEMLPMIMFQGDQDPTVDIDSSFSNSCVSPPLMYGPRSLYTLLTNFGVCSELTVKIGGGHGVYTSTPAQDRFRVNRASCFFKSVFCNTCSNFYTTDSIAASCRLINGTNNLQGNNIKVYPNPFVNTLTLLNLQGYETIELTNQLGQVFYNGRAVPTHDFSWLAPGIYFLKIATDSSANIIKLIKE